MNMMEAGMNNFDERWLAVQQLLRERFGKVPDLESILFLVGLNEVGAGPGDKFTKEQKQDLMHVAVCTLLAQLGYFEFAGRDGDGWPHFHVAGSPPQGGLLGQEQMLKECVVRYFDL